MASHRELVIVTYCSVDYRPGLDFVIKSWLKHSSRIIVYTDGELGYCHPRVAVRLHFAQNDNWLTHVGRKSLAALHAVGSEALERLVFLDCDCLVRGPISDALADDYDLGVTGLFTRGAYADGTSNCGVWFGHSTERLKDFLESWCRLSEQYRAAGRGVIPGRVAFDQYAFSDLAKDCYRNRSVRIALLDERVYNCEHSNIAKWRQMAYMYQPMILHFKGQRFRDKQFVRDMCDLADRSTMP